MNINFLKRIIIAVFVTVSVILPCAAGDLMMEGYGSTAEKARENARSNLSEYINGVYVRSETFSSASDDSTSSSGTFSSASSSTTSGYLKAVEYENEYGKGILYYSTAVIRDNDSNTSAFVSYMKSADTTISSLYGKLSGMSNSQKKNSLTSIYAAISEYETYRSILMYMGHSDLIPALSVNVSRTSIYTEYQNIVIEEGYELEEKQKTVKDESEYQRLLEELSANRTEQRRLEREKNDAITAQEEASRTALEDMLKLFAVETGNRTTAVAEDNRFLSLKADLLNKRDNFLSGCTEYDRLSKEQFELIDKDYEAEKSAVEARAYRFAELQDGVPTEAAKNIREEEIEYLYILKELHKVEVFKQIREVLIPLLQTRYDEYRTAAEEIDGEIFEYIFTSDEISNVTTSFDSTNAKWTVKVNLKGVDGIKKRFTFNLSYKQLTGKEVQEPKYRGQKGYSDYLDYLDDVDYLQTVISSFEKSFTITMKFKANVNSDDGIGYTSISFSDIQFVLDSSVIPDNPDWTLIIPASSSSIDDTDLSWSLPGYAGLLGEEFSDKNIYDNKTFLSIINGFVGFDAVSGKTVDSNSFDSMGYDVTVGDVQVYSIAAYKADLPACALKNLKYIGYTVDNSLSAYFEAKVLLENGKYSDAYELLSGIFGYSDSVTLAAKMLMNGQLSDNQTADMIKKVIKQTSLSRQMSSVGLLSINVVSNLIKKNLITVDNLSEMIKKGLVASGTATNLYENKLVTSDFAVSMIKKELYILKIGDKGPAGGYIFYDKGSYSDGWRYLEAAPNDLAKTYVFGGYGTTIGNTSTAVGTGKSNTEAIVKKLGNGTSAAKACSDYTYNGYDDWFLPSKDELNLMYTNLCKKGLGNFRDSFYWSSSEGSRYNAWSQDFSNGNQNYYDRDGSKYVRPIRAF